MFFDQLFPNFPHVTCSNPVGLIALIVVLSYDATRCAIAGTVARHSAPALAIYQAGQQICDFGFVSGTGTLAAIEHLLDLLKDPFIDDRRHSPRDLDDLVGVFAPVVVSFVADLLLMASIKSA
jgi:hypothetical protein